MSDKDAEPTQTTPEGAEIPVPERVDVFADLAKVAKVSRPIPDVVPDPADWTPEQWDKMRRLATEPDPSDN